MPYYILQRMNIQVSLSRSNQINDDWNQLSIFKFHFLLHLKS